MTNKMRLVPAGQFSVYRWHDMWDITIIKDSKGVTVSMMSFDMVSDTFPTLKEATDDLTTKYNAWARLTGRQLVPEKR